MLPKTIMKKEESNDSECIKKTYIDGNNIRGPIEINRCIREELGFAICACFELEEDLILPNSGEVEPAPVKGLHYLVNSEFSGPLLNVAALVQLSYEATATRNHLKQKFYHINKWKIYFSSTKYTKTGLRQKTLVSQAVTS